MSDTQPMMISPNDYKAQQVAQAKAKAATLNLDVAPSGGVYRTAGGQLVNANGETVKARPVQSTGTVSPRDEYEAMTVPELRELASARQVDIPADAKKAEVIAALNAADAGGDSGSGQGS